MLTVNVFRVGSEGQLGTTPECMTVYDLSWLSLSVVVCVGGVAWQDAGS